jgi:hypothetical protein
MEKRENRRRSCVNEWKTHMRKRILEIHRGSLARIFVDVNFKRIFPDAKDIIEARKKARKIYPKDEEFMVFELV